MITPSPGKSLVDPVSRASRRAAGGQAFGLSMIHQGRMRVMNKKRINKKRLPIRTPATRSISNTILSLFPPPACHASDIAWISEPVHLTLSISVYGLSI